MSVSLLYVIRAPDKVRILIKILEYLFHFFTKNGKSGVLKNRLDDTILELSQVACSFVEKSTRESWSKYPH